MEQMRMQFAPTSNGVYMNYTVWQPETKYKPWAVHAEGWSNSNLKVTIYHEDIAFGAMHMERVRVKSAREFAEYCAKMIRSWAVFHPDTIEVRAIDLLELMNGYRKGLEKR